MATVRLAEKEVLQALTADAKILVTEMIDIEGEQVSEVFRTSFPAFVAMLKQYGLDESHFTEIKFNPDNGYLYVLDNGTDVIEPCYIGRFAEVDENGIIPEENLPCFNKSDTLFAEGVPLYGTRFVDVTEDGEIIIRKDGSGDYLLTALEDGTVKAVKVKTHIADTLDSDSDTEALSAKQGKVLSTWIGVLGDLLTTAKTSIVGAVNELFNSLKSHKENTSNPHSVTKSQVGLGNVSNVEQASKAEFNTHTGNTSNPHGVSKAQVGLGNVDNTADNVKNVLSAVKLTTVRKINGVSFDGTADITIADGTKIPTSQKGAAGGVAELDQNGMVPAAQLPSYVDDIVEGTLATFPRPGESGKIYLDTGTNLTYRWSGSDYVEVSKSLALGETASTAYAGNKGKKNAEDIADLQGRMENAENGKVDKETYNADMLLKADLENGIVPDAELPYYNKTQNVYVDGVLLYPTTFVSVNADGDIYLTEDGTGEFLLFIAPDGIPRIRYTGTAITDDVTGLRYSITISNNEVFLTKI